MKDAYFDPGVNDITFPDGEVVRAKNLFEVQVGSLYYLPAWGVDLEFFLNPEYQIQNESFEAHLVQRLGEFGFNVLSLTIEAKEFVRELDFTFGQNQNQTLIRG